MHAEPNAPTTVLAVVAVTVVEVFSLELAVLFWNALIAAVQNEGCFE
jgi:hypothetical protein